MRNSRNSASNDCIPIHAFTSSKMAMTLIITVWVDNLLLIVKPDKLMEQTKSDLHTEWEMTNLGEPTKIIGIEISNPNQ